MSRRDNGSRGGPYSMDVLRGALPSYSTSDGHTGRSSDSRTGRSSKRLEDSPQPPSRRTSSRYIETYSDDDYESSSPPPRRRRSRRSPSPKYTNTTTTSTAYRHPLSNAQSTKPKYKSSRSHVPNPEPYLRDDKGKKRDPDSYSKACDQRYWPDSGNQAPARDSNPYDSHRSSDRKSKDSRYYSQPYHY